MTGRRAMKTVAELAAEVGAAGAQLAWFDTRTSSDPAVARLAGRALAQHHRNTDRDLARYTALTTRVASLRHSLAVAQAREAEQARARITPDEVKGARAVRDRHGWHKVVRVSAATVTVEAGYSWTNRISIEKIVEVSR